MKLSFLLIFLFSSEVWAGFSVSTYNIRNFDKDREAGRTDLPALGRIIKDTKSDVMAFQEIVNVEAFHQMVATTLPDYLSVVSGCGGFGKQNLAVAYNPKVFKFITLSEDRTFSGSTSGECGSLRPVFLVTLEKRADKTQHTFGVVHLKAGADQRAFSLRWQQYEGLRKLSQSYEKKNLILLGDFNTTGYIAKDEDYTRFETFMNFSNLRSTTETLGCTNYWSGNLGGEEFQPSVLDHIVIQGKVINQIQEVSVGTHCARRECKPSTPNDLGVTYQSVSDHCPVRLSFK